MTYSRGIIPLRPAFAACVLAALLLCLCPPALAGQDAAPPPDDGRAPDGGQAPHAQAHTDHHVVKSTDLENRHVQLDVQYLYKSYKDGTSSYLALPIMIRFDTGPFSELRLSTDFLTYQKPALGFSDISLGFKWNFHKGNPSLGLLGSVEFPNGSAGLADPAMEPSARLLFDYSFGKNWTFSANGGWSSMVDVKSFIRYNRINYASELACAVSPKNRASIIFTGYGPDKSPGGIPLTRLFAGFYHEPRKNVQYNLFVGRGLAPRDVDWMITGGVSRRF